MWHTNSNIDEGAKNYKAHKQLPQVKEDLSSTTVLSTTFFLLEGLYVEDMETLKTQGTVPAQYFEGRQGVDFLIDFDDLTPQQRNDLTGVWSAKPVGGLEIHLRTPLLQEWARPLLDRADCYTCIIRNGATFWLHIAQTEKSCIASYKYQLGLA